MNPQDRTWTIVESFFHPEQISYYETILTIGNGYLGTRGTFEEGYLNDEPSTLIHGIFNHDPADLVPDLSNIPVWFGLEITLDGESFQLDQGKILGYRRWLDMRTGILRRNVLWQSPSGKVLRLEFERFASMANSHLLLQKVRLTALDEMTLVGNAQVDDRQAINMAYAANGPEPVSHWINVQKGTNWWQAETNQSYYTVAMTQHVIIDGPDSKVTTESEGARFIGKLAYGESVSLTRYVAVATSRDAEDVLAYTQSQIETAVQSGYDTLLTQNEVAWGDLWQDMDICIEGDELAQQAIHFVTYHLLIAAPRHDDRVSIGAKTLSGRGYKGHVFWDTEFFMLPPFTLARPDIARNLLMYRYHNLPGARQKARDAGYKGAMFPWESTDTGLETTPQWTLPDKNGKRIRIWTGDHEQHISADITFAIWQYWQWTGDDDFFINYGAEIILDTALFWESRVEWNADKQHYELTQQIGPDEFHENIDNSVYTNCFTAWHLEYAIKSLNWLQTHIPDQAEALCTQLGITNENIKHWDQIANSMYLPRDPERNVYEQFEGYFDRQFIDVSLYSPRTTSMDTILGHEAINASQVIKQADVVMMMAILGDRLGDREELLRNWHVYVPRTANDSSLSPAIHAWVGVNLGLVEEAYRFWIQGAGLDLENNKGNVRDGIHAAACGGLWQAIVFGFAGLRLDTDGWTVNPNLPEAWRSISFSFFFKGEKHTVTLKNEE